MAKLRHIWFDLDFTLFDRRKYIRLEADILNAMYKFAAEKLGWQIDKVMREYDRAYRQCESHTGVFRALGLPPAQAKEIYHKVDTASYLHQDERLIRMFNSFKEKKLPFSVYSNSFAGAIDRSLKKLGLNPLTFEYRLPGEAFPKVRLDGGKSAGFKRIVDLSKSLESRLNPSGEKLQPEQILYIGDREKVDIKPANEEGLTTALVWTKRKRSEADYTLPTLYAIRPVVDSLVH